MVPPEYPTILGFSPFRSVEISVDVPTINNALTSNKNSDRRRGRRSAGEDGRDRLVGRRRPHDDRSQQAARAVATRGPGSHRGRSLGGE